MKAKELQIGDWLWFENRVNAFPFRVEQITRRKVGYHAEPGENRMHYLRLHECRPIPLTPEILTRNGFKALYGDCYELRMEEELTNPRSGVTETFISEVSIRRNVYPEDDVLWDIEAGRAKVQNVSHVHELQQVMRLGGIGKEITV